MLVKHRMSRDPVTVTPDDTLARALDLTRTHRIRHLPVVTAGSRLSGILSDRDIRLAMPSPLSEPDWNRADYLERTPIAAVMTREVVTVRGNVVIEDAARLLYRHRIGSLPVVTTGQVLEGILTETDILHAFVQLLGGGNPPPRVEIALADRPGELGRALQVLLDELGLNVDSLVVPSARRTGRTSAIVHLDTPDPAAALAALEAAGFTVGSPALPDPPEPAADG